tara:strand:- start:467 stop:1432 length:966 start_codon:yes stop_codon:yes gene_type:complete
MIKKKIAIIGAGYWGSIIINTLTNLKFKNIVVHDINKSNLNIIKKKFNNICIENKLTNILKDNDINYVIVATPPSKNYKVVRQLILNKKNIFLEKPGFKNLNEIDKIQKLLSKFKIKMMFGYIYCYNNQIDTIKKILEKEKLGKILYISFNRKNLGPIRNDVDVDYDLSSHDLSIILKLFGKLPKIISHKKYCILKKNIADISNLHLKLNNVYIDINNSWLNPTKERLIKIVGTKKMLLYNEMDFINPIKIYNQYAKYPTMDFFDKKFINSKALIYKGNNKSIKIKSNNPLSEEIKYFLNSKKNYTDISFSKKILKFLKGV